MTTNFLRVLKFAWPYRFRFVLSVVCALIVALFWSLNLSAIYPVLQIIGNNKNLQQWVDDEIAVHQKELDRVDRLEKLAQLRIDLKEVEQKEDHPDRENVCRRYTKEIADIEGKLNYFATWVYRYQLLKSQVVRLLPTDRFEQFLWIIGAVIIGVAIKGVFEFINESLVGSITNGTLYDLRNHCYRQMMHQDIRQIGLAGSPELMSRFTNDMDQLGNGIKVLLGKMIAEPLRALGCLIFACYISWQLTLVFVLLVPLALATLMKVSKMMRKAARRLLQQMSDIFKILRESIEGYRVVKAFTMEPHERRRFRRATRDYYYRAMRIVHIDAFANPMIELLGVIAIGLALSAGTYLVVTGNTHIFGIRMTATPMQFATLLQLYALLAAIADPVRKLSSVYTKLQSAEAASKRIFEVFDRTPSVTTNVSGSRVGRLSKQLEFRNVSFSYEPGRDILSSINLSVKAGETIAIVGPNGCGKSTLLGLLPRFFDPVMGAVHYDGVNIRGAHLRSLRRQIAVVTQETRLFDATIFDNIAYGRKDATLIDVAIAAIKADIHSFILSLPEGYVTMAGDMGSPKFSGGQQQKIALARAIIRNPSLLILDEFTSAADAESEAAIFEDLRSFVKGRTTFLITHRLHTLEIADRIVVMEDGRIVDVGQHDELLRRCDLYQRLCAAQKLRIAA